MNTYISITIFNSKEHKCDLVMYLVGRWASNSKGVGSILGHSVSGNNLRQVVHTHASVTKQYKLVCLPVTEQ